MAETQTEKEQDTQVRRQENAPTMAGHDAYVMAANNTQQSEDQTTSKPAASKKGENYGPSDVSGFGNLPEQVKKYGDTFPQAPSTEVDIHAALSQYMDQLSNLGPEYGEEMKFLQPYIAGGQTGGLTAPAYTGPNAAGVNASQAALGASEQQTAEAYQNMNTPGFGNASKMAEQYISELPYQQPIQAALGYQKYLETYGGLSPSTSGVPTDIQNIYKAIGANSSTGGLPTPGQAAAAGNANALLNTAGNQPTSTPGQ